MSSGSVASLIPEIYYDLIARISSGIPFVIVLFWETNLYSDNVTTLNKTSVFFVVLGAGYLAGTLLTTISAIIHYIVWGFLQLVTRILNFETSIPTKSLREIFSTLYEKIDMIAKKDQVAGTILKKMEANAGLADNLFSGYLILSVTMFFLETTHEFNIWIFSPIFILLIATMVLKRVLLVGRLDTLYKNLENKGEAINY
ncbi:MAG: hypothetical protein CMD96_03855 [Gammaproteobacteria bacterium]|mgnify:CR=1 FL=1|nr:hypothetical protein [Gammaproteobacteria bacterium]HJP18998.1 hypothetical protein [Nitrospinota bacterium]|tara:strand:- start:1666 stop:2265 length:600 start_codon:yes stop_codon:yes gene_type:complete